MLDPAMEAAVVQVSGHRRVQVSVVADQDQITLRRLTAQQPCPGDVVAAGDVASGEGTAGPQVHQQWGMGVRIASVRGCKAAADPALEGSGREGGVRHRWGSDAPILRAFAIKPGIPSNKL